MTTVDRSLVVRALEDAGKSADDIRDKYSGRHMFDAQCFAIVCASQREAYLFFVALGYIAGAVDDVFNLCNSATFDDWGKYDIILYFPGYTLSPEESHV